MSSPESSSPSFEAIEEPEPSRPDISQAYQVANELVDPLWEDLLNAIRYRDNEAYEVAAKNLRESYYYMLDAMNAYRSGQSEMLLTPEQEERIQDQIDICQRCHVRLRM